MLHFLICQGIRDTAHFITSIVVVGLCLFTVEDDKT